MFKLNYKHGILFISLLLIICLSLSVVSAVEDSTLNNISEDSIMVVNSDIENSLDIEVSNLEINSNNDRDDQEISNVSADKTFANIQQQINSASSGATITLSGTYVGSGSQINLNKTLTIDGQGATLDGKGLSRIFNVTAANCIIKNINFINGNKDYGGAIYWSGNKGTMTGCTFINCTASSNGGAIYWRGTGGSVSNSNFIGDSASSGGSIYWNGVNGTLFNSNFINSSASTYGGSVYWYESYGKIYNCSFNNSIDTSFSGGAIYVSAVNCSIYDSTFFNCSAIGGSADGGAIYLVTANVTISNCNFTGTHSTRNGGGIAVSSNAFNAKIENCVFDKCYSQSQGGAIYLDNIASGPSNYKIISSDFKNCSANYAGAIYIRGSSNLVNYCNFLDCKATTSGGAISFDCDNSLLNNSYFNNCNAVFAGAIYVTGSSSSVDCSNFYNCNCMAQTTLVVSGSISWAGDYGKLTNSNFINSTISCLISSGWVTDESTYAYGGSVAWYGSNGLVDNCNFINSTIDDTLNTYGGSIYWVGDNGKVIDSTFINSKSYAAANGDGGSIFWDSTNGEIAFCTFTNSSTDSRRNSTGGSVYLNNTNSNAVLTNCTFEDSHINITGTVRDAKGIVIYSANTKEIYNSSFIMKPGDVAGDMVYGVDLDTLIDQANNFVLKSSITVNDFSSDYGSKINLTANVKNESGSNINEGSVNFYKNGTLIGTANVVNGKATYTYTCDDVGIFELKVVYSGSNKYGPSIATSTLSINNAILETNTSVNNISSSYNETVNIIATVKTKNNLVVNGGTITFYIGNNVIATADVINGSATCSYKCNITGNNSIRAVYSGFGNFNSSNTTFTLNVAKLDTNIVVNPMDASYGRSVNLSATVKVNNVNVNNGIVKFYVNNNFVGEATVSNGLAIYSYIPDMVGTFTYKAEYQGSDYYNPSAASSSLHISNVATKVIVNPISADYGDSVTLTANVKTTDDIPITVGVVTFYINNVKVGNATVSNGIATCSYMCNVTGNFTIKAVYNGPTGFNSAENISTLSVSSKGTITTLDFGDASYGGVVEFNATVTSPNAVVNEGTVKFYVGENVIAEVNVVNGVARCNYTCNNMGTFNIKAVYSGSNAFEPSTSNIKQVIVGKINTITTIEFSPAYYNQPVTLTATVRTVDGNPVNEGAVKFYINGKSKGTVNVVNGVACFNFTFGEVNSFTIKASFNGSSRLNSSTCSTQLFVNNLTTYVTVEDISANYGETVTLIATVSSELSVPDSYVNFYVGGEFCKRVRTSNGVARCDYTCNDTGSLIIRVDYEGADGFAPSSGTGNLNSNVVATKVIVNPISADYGDSVTLTANVKTTDNAPINGGTVTFYVDGVKVGNGSVVDGIATCSYICNNIGNLVIRADYGGDASYSSSSNTSSLSVAKLNTVITMESASISSNNTITLVVNIHSNIPVNEGTVAFYMNGSKIGDVDVSNGVATLIYDCDDFGIFEITANYSGSSIFNSSKLIYELNVDSLKTIITVNPISANYNDTVTLTATIKTDSGDIVNEGNATFYIGTVKIATVQVNEDGIATCSYMCNGLGNFSINVVYSGSVKYDSSTNSSTLNVNPLDTTVSVSDISANYAEEITLTANVKTTDNNPVNEGIVIFYIDGNEVGRNNLNNGVANYNYICNNVGTFNVIAVYEGPSYFRPSNSSFKLNVSKVNTYITVDDFIAHYDDKLDIQIPIKSNGGTINDGTVKFYVNDNYVGNDTVDNGFVTFTYDCVEVGNFNVKIIYEGCASFNPCNSTFRLSVDSVGTQVIINNITASYGDVVVLNADVEATDGSEINNGIVNFYVDNVFVGNASVIGGVASYNYKCINTGDFSIKAIFTGFDAFDSSNATATLKVIKAGTIIYINPISTSYNDSVVLNASVKTVDGVAVVDGLVTFYVDGSEVGSAYVDANGVASYNYKCSAVGSFTVEAIYSGATGYNGSSGVSSLSVGKLATVTVVDSVVADYNDVVVLNASVKTVDNIPVNDGVVTFYIDDVKVGNASVVNGVASYNYSCDKVGSFTVEAIYGGSGVYDGSSGVSSLSVGKLATVTVVDSVVADYNDVVVLNASVKTVDGVAVVDGLVTFYVDGSEVGSASVVNGVASYSYTCDKVGSFTVEAIYGGSGVYDGSSGVSTLNVTKLDTVTVVDSVVANYNDVVVLNASVKTVDNILVNEGVVTFYVNGTNVGTSNVVNGVATYSYTCDKVGSFTVEAIYGGSGVYDGSTNVSTLNVAKLDTVTNVNSISANYNDVVVLNASVKTVDNIPVNDGVVTFYIDDVKVGNASVVNGVASYNYTCNNTGNFTIRADYSGCESYNPSNNSSKLEVNIVDVIMKPGTVFSSNFTADLVVYITTQDNVNITGGIVTFYVNGTKVGNASVVNGVASYKYHYDSLGEYEFKAIYSGFESYSSTNISSKFNTSSLTTLISADAVYTISGDVVTLIAYISAEGNKTVNGGTVTFSNGEDVETAYVVDGVATCSHIFNSYGIFDLEVVYNGLENYFKQSSVLTTLTVGYIPTNIVVSCDSSSVEYGETVTLTANVGSDAIVNDGTVTFYVDGSEVGSASVVNGVATYSYTCDKVGNLVIKAVYTNSKLFNESTSNSLSLVVNKAQATMTLSIPTSCYYKAAKLTIKLVNTKTGALIANEKVNITIGSVKVTVTTNANGVATYNIALAPKSSYYSAKVVLDSDNYNCAAHTKTFKIIKATSVIIYPYTLTTTYNSKAAFQVKVYKGSYLFVGVKLKLKVYTGSKYSTVTITTGSNGIAKYTGASVLSVAKHKVVISCGESTSYMTATQKTSYITVNKAPTVVSAPQVTNIYKKSAYFKITVKMKSTGITVPSGVALTLKVYTGSSYKTYTVKTNANGVASLNTNALTVGTHKVVVSSGHSYYTISATSYITIIKEPTTVSAPQVTNTYKQSAYFKATVKIKSTGAAVPSGVALTLKVYTGSSYKTYTVKTNANGVASFNTNVLTVGTHKVVISTSNAYYTISATSSIIIKK